jgi:hypothetical protein
MALFGGGHSMGLSAPFWLAKPFCSAPLTRARAAKAIERYGVRFDAKARRRELAHVLQAAVHIEDALASLASKVMVVAFAGALVARRFSGDLDRFEPRLFKERSDGAIGRRDADPSGRADEFVDRQRPFRTLENLTDRLALASLSRTCVHLFILPRRSLPFTAAAGALDYLQMIR